MPNVLWTCCGRAQRMPNDHWACAPRTLRVLSASGGRATVWATSGGRHTTATTHSVGATYAARPLSEWGACCCVQNVPITLLQRMVNVCIAFWVRWANFLSMLKTSAFVNVRPAFVSVLLAYPERTQRTPSVSIRYPYVVCFSLV